MKQVLFIAFVITSLFVGCISYEKKVQEVKFATDMISSIGAVDNQMQLQKINWRVNITNIGGKTAENVTIRVILHPEVISRLNSSYIDSVMLYDLQPGFSAGFNGSATFDAIGLSKQDIAAWEPLFSIRITWVEDSSEKEQIIKIHQ